LLPVKRQQLLTAGDISRYRERKRQEVSSAFFCPNSGSSSKSIQLYLLDNLGT
jgi:hypothetical protein